VLTEEAAPERAEGDRKVSVTLEEDEEESQKNSKGILTER